VITGPTHTATVPDRLQPLSRILASLLEQPESIELSDSLKACMENYRAAGKDSVSSEEIWHCVKQTRERALKAREPRLAVKLLEYEVTLAPSLERDGLVLRIAKLQDEELLDDEAAGKTYKLLANVLEAEDALERIVLRGEKWAALVERYEQEAGEAPDPVFRSSLLAAAAEIRFRHWFQAKRGKKKSGLEEVCVQGLEALSLDPTNERAFRAAYRAMEDLRSFPEMAKLLASHATHTALKEDKVVLLIASAKLYDRELHDGELASALYHEVLELDLTHAGAVAALAESYTSRKQWDALAALYEGQVATAMLSVPEEHGALLQAAMVHYRMCGDARSALPLYERVRGAAPAHPSVLDFFREYCAEKQDWSALEEILAQAFRSTTDPVQKLALEKERNDASARRDTKRRRRDKLVESLRQKPEDVRLLSELREDYRTTGELEDWASLLGAHQALVSDSVLRAGILTELGTLYRAEIPNASKLLSILESHSELEPENLAVLTEVAELYGSSGRGREELIVTQKLAALESDKPSQVEQRKLCARRWLTEFGNANNAAQLYEQVLVAQPDDVEASRELRDIYTKKRDLVPLLGLLERAASASFAADDAGSVERVHEACLEAGRVSELLEKDEAALKWFSKASEVAPSDPAALAALEALAVRTKDHRVLLYALERKEPLTAESSDRIELLLRIAALAGERLSEPQKAESAYKRILAIDPAHQRASLELRDALLLRGETEELMAVYRARGELSEFVDVLLSYAEKGIGAEAKVRLLQCAADLLREPSAEQDAGREAIALERLIELQTAQDGGLQVRPDSAQLLLLLERLIVLYEDAGEHSKLASTFAKVVEVSGDRSTRAAALLRLAELEYGADPRKALESVKWAAELDPDREGVWERFEGYAREREQLDVFVDALGKPQALSAPKQRKLANVLRELGREGEALVVLNSLAFGESAAPEAMFELDELVRARGNADELRDFLEKKIASTRSAIDQREILLELADSEDVSFGEPARALEVYSRVLQLEPSNAKALRGASRLAIQTSNAESALFYLTRERELCEGEAQVLRDIEIANVHVNLRKSGKDALLALEAALSDGKVPHLLIPALEPLLLMGDVRAAVAEKLLSLYEQVGELDKEPTVLRILIATRSAKSDRYPLYERLAEVLQRLGRHEEAFEALQGAVREFPAEASIWHVYFDVAKTLGRERTWMSDLAQALPEQGATMPEATSLELAIRAEALGIELADDALTLRFGLKVFDSDATDVERLHRLTALYAKEGREAEASRLYGTALEKAALSARPALLLEGAKLAERTGDMAVAASRYEALLGLRDALLPSESEVAFAQAALLSIYQKQFIHSPKHDALVADILMRDPSGVAARSACTSLLAVRKEEDASAFILLLSSRGEPAIPALGAVSEQFAGSPNAQVRVLLALAEIEKEPFALAERLCALGACYEVLRKSDDAINAFEKALVQAPEHPGSLAALERLYGSAGDIEKQRQALRTLERVELDPERRAMWLTHSASLALKQDDYGEAISVYQVLVDDFGPTEVYARPLIELLRSQQRHAEVTEVLGRQIDANLNDVSKTELLFELANHCRLEVGDHTRAVDLLVELLASDAGADPAVRTRVWRELHELTLTGAARKEAAEVLLKEHASEPALQEHALSVLVDYADETERLALIERVLGVLASDNYKAIAHWETRALSEHTEVPAFGSCFARAENAARSAGALEDFAQATAALTLRTSSLEGERAARLGLLVSGELGQKEVGLTWLESARESGNRSVLSPLCALYRVLKEPVKLDAALGELAADSSDPSERRAIFFERALLAEVGVPGQLAVDPERAIGFYEDAAIVLFDAEVCTKLKSLYEGLGRAGDLASLMARELEAASWVGAAERPALLVLLGDVRRNAASDADGALEAYAEALQLQPSNEGARAGLFALMATPEHTSRASGLVEQACRTASDWEGLAHVLGARASLEDGAVKRDILGLLFEVHLSKREKRTDAMDVAFARLGVSVEMEDASFMEADATVLRGVADTDALRAHSSEKTLALVRALDHFPVELDLLALDAGIGFEKASQLEDALFLFRKAYAAGREPARTSAYTLVDRLLSRMGDHEGRVLHLRSGAEGKLADPLETEHTIAHLFERELADEERAIASFEACLELTADDRVALSALERLYGAPERLGALRGLLARRGLLERDSASQARIQIALSEASERASDLPQAVLDLRDFIDSQEQASDRDEGATLAVIARLEMLSVGSESAQVLELLEATYKQRGDEPGLERTLTRMASLASPEEKKNRLLTLASELEDRAPARALAVLGEALPVTGGKTADEIADQLEALAERSGLWDVCAEVYAECSKNVARDIQALALRRLAGVHDRRRDDPRKALSVFSELKAAAGVDLGELDAMDRLATLLSDWKSLDSTLIAKIPFQEGPEAQAQTWRRIAEQRRDMLGSKTEAIAAYEASLELEPSSVFAIDSLRALLDHTADAPRLLSLLRRRAELTDNVEERVPYLLEASVLAEQGADVRQAIELRTLAHTLAPDDSANMRSLAGLLESQEVWSDWLLLVPGLRDLADTAEAKAALFEREGDIRAKVNRDASGAIAAYEAASTLFYRRETLDKIVRYADSAPTLELAERLARAHQDDDALVRVLQLQARTEGDQTLRTLLWTEAAAKTSSRTQAIGFLMHAVRDSKFDAQVSNLLETRLVDASDDAKIAYLTLLEDEASSSGAIRVRLARFRRDTRRDGAGAAKEFERALLAPDEPSFDKASVLLELEASYLANGDETGRMRCLTRRLEAEPEPLRQAALCVEIATVKAAVEPHEAAAYAERAIRLVPSHEAARAFLMLRVEAHFLLLDEVLSGLPDLAPLRDLYEARIARESVSTERRRLQQLFASRLEAGGNLAAAFEVYAEICSEDPFYPRAIAELERLGTAQGLLLDTEEALARGASRVSASTELGELWMKIGQMRNERGSSEASAAFEHAAVLLPRSEAARASLSAALGAMGRTDEAVLAMISQAQVSSDPSPVFQEAYRKAAEELGQFELAEKVLRAAVQVDPSAAWALRARVDVSERLGQRPSGQWMVQLSDAVANPRESVRWRVRAAETFDGAGDAKAAITLYEDVLRQEPEREEVLIALKRLQSERPADFARNVSMSLVSTLLPEIRTKRRCELAQLQEQELGDSQAALETLRSVLLEDPEHPEARERVHTLLVQLGKPSELAEYLENERKRRGLSPASMLELARLYEGLLPDPSKAIALYETASVLSESREEALTALGRIHESRREYAKAAHALQKLSEAAASASPSLFRRIAMLSEKSGDSAVATVALEQAADRGDTEASALLEKMYEKSGDFVSLSKLLEAELSKGSSRSVELSKRLAVLYLEKLENPAAAIPLLESLPDERDVSTMLSFAYEKCGRPSDAVTMVGRIIRSYGVKRTREVAALHARAAALYVGLNEKDAALSELDAAFKIEPGNLKVLRSLAELSMATGDLERAQKTLRSLLLQKLDATGPLGKGQVFLWLGEVAEKQGEKIKAIQMFERAIENDPALARSPGGDVSERIKALR
jgi:golgin subfamily B member 1